MRTGNELLGYVAATDITTLPKGKRMRYVKEGVNGPRTDYNAPTIYGTQKAAFNALSRAIKAVDRLGDYVVVPVYANFKQRS